MLLPDIDFASEGSSKEPPFVTVKSGSKRVGRRGTVRQRLFPARRRRREADNAFPLPAIRERIPLRHRLGVGIAGFLTL